VTVTVGAVAAKFKLPVPVPSLPALSTILPSVVVKPVVPAPFMFRFDPAFAVRFPLVVVMALFRVIAPAAFNVMFPPVVVMAAFAFRFPPAFATMLPPVDVMAAFTFTSRKAFNVRVVGLGVGVQVTASFTKMSPLPGVTP
jgi:hypothetical protein